MSDTTDRLIALAATRFKVDRDAIQASDDLFQTLGIDSFQAVELLTDLELEFDVEIPDYELQGTRTFADLAQKIDQRR